MKGLILDLRDNPGGLLSVGGRDLRPVPRRGADRQHQGAEHRHQVVRGARRKGPTPTSRWPSWSTRTRPRPPRSSRPASRTTTARSIVGQRSFGKGSVQNILDLEDGNSVLKLTVATYWRPSGKNIHQFKDAKDKDEWGVSPDPGMEVKLSRDEYKSWAEGRRDRDLFSTAKGKAGRSRQARGREAQGEPRRPRETRRPTTRPPRPKPMPSRCQGRAEIARGQPGEGASGEEAVCRSPARQGAGGAQGEAGDAGGQEVTSAIALRPPPAWSRSER